MNIMFYLCENSGYPLYEEYGTKKKNWTIEKIKCAGKLEKDKILELLNEKYDKVVIISCFEGSCRYVYGNVRCDNRINSLKKEFESLQLDPNLIEIHSFTSNMNDEFKELMSRF